MGAFLCRFLCLLFGARCLLVGRCCWLWFDVVCSSLLVVCCVCLEWSLLVVCCLLFVV